MKTKSTLRSFLLAAGSSLLAISSASAQINWSGATNGDWLTTTNWTGGDPAGDPAATTNTDIAVFNVNANNTIGINMTTAGGNYYLGAIDNTNATARIIQNTSGTTGVLTLNGATVNSVANTILRNSTTTLLTIGNSGSGTLGLALGNATANVIQITGTGGITISSIISGSNGITKQGTGGGSLTLSGNNSYTGVTAITAGAIAISNNNALGATGTGNNTTIAATGASTSARLLISGNINSAENITITGISETGSYTAPIQNTGNTNTLSGNITLAGTGGIKIQAKAGTLNLTGNISQTVTTHGLTLQAEGGSAVLNVSNGLAINGAPLLLVGANASTGVITLSGGGTTGTTTLASRATLRLGVTNALTTNRNLTFGYLGTTAGEDIATFDLRGFNQTINVLNSLVNTANASANSNRIVTNGVAGTSILTLGNGGGSGTFAGQINSGTGNIQLIKTGTGNQTLGDTNSYTGGTRIDEGILTLGHATNTLANTGAVNVNGGTLALGTNTDTVGAVTLTSGSITSSTGVLTGTSYAVQSGSVSAILGGTGVALTKTTGGTVTLSGANTYTGATTASEGTLKMGANNVVPDASNVSIGTATLDADTRTDTAGTLDVTGAAVINLGTGAALAFAKSSAVDWTDIPGTLNITGTLGATSLRFGDELNQPGLTPAQLALISVNGSGLGTYVLDANGYLIPGGGGPGPVNSFEVSAIASPQTVGTPFTGITITAKDASNVTATGFTGTVTFGGTGGFTGTSASFVLGVLSGVSVTPTVAGSNLTFTVDDGATHTGSTTITTIQTQYQFWAGGALFGDDANDDGVDNGLAFLLGAGGPNDNALGLLPTVTQSSGNLILNFKCLNTAKRGSAMLKVQYSKDLGITDLWDSHLGDSAVVPGTAPTTVTVGGVDFASTVFDTDKNNIQATIPASAAAPGTKLFGRLKAEQP